MTKKIDEQIKVVVKPVVIEEPKFDSNPKYYSNFFDDSPLEDDEEEGEGEGITQSVGNKRTS